MGYSYSNNAGRVLERIEAEMKTQGRRCSNEYADKKGNEYFIEVDRKTQPDDGIRGSIEKMLPGNMAKRAGRFHITGDGRLISAPAHFMALLEASGAKRVKGHVLRMGGAM